jgi:MFS family permease
MNSTTATPTARKPGLFINRNFGLLWLGQTISIMGDFAFSITLVVWIYATLAKDQPWAPLAVTGVLVATTVPMVLVGPLAGVFVDRADKRGLMMVMSVFQALAAGALIALTGVFPIPFLDVALPLEWKLGAVYGVVFLINACEQFFRPAQMALLGDIVAEEYRGRASGLLQASGSLGILIGPLLAPLVVVTFGVEWTLLFDALSFLVAFLTLLAMRVPHSTRSVAKGERGHFGREFGAGLRFFVGSQVSRTILVAGVIVLFGAGAINALDIFFATQNLRATIPEYGVLSGAGGVGLLLGSILAAIFVARIGYGRVVWGSLIAIGALMLVYARMTSLWPAVALVALIGVPNAALNVAITPLLLLVTPRALVGRSMAILTPAINAASLAGMGLAGYLASVTLAGFHEEALGFTFGPVDTIFMVGGLIALLGGVYCALRLRSSVIEREHVHEEPPVTDSAESEMALAGVGIAAPDFD